MINIRHRWYDGMMSCVMINFKFFLNFPKQYIHLSFPMSFFNFVYSFLHECTVFMLYRFVPNKVWQMGLCLNLFDQRILPIELTNRVSGVAPSSSYVGIDCIRIRATLVLECEKINRPAGKFSKIIVEIFECAAISLQLD